MLEVVDGVGTVLLWLWPDRPERPTEDRTVPRFSLGGRFERSSIPALLERTEPFEPLPWWKRRRIDGRMRGRVGVRAFRVTLTHALILPVDDQLKVLGATAQGAAYFGPLPSAFSQGWSVPRQIELFVCGRVIEGWRPRGRLRAARVPAANNVGYAASMVATLGDPSELPTTLQRWFVHGCGGSRRPGGRPGQPGRR